MSQLERIYRIHDIFAEGKPAEVLTPPTLEAVYGLLCRVTQLPEGYPMVIPTPAALGESETPEQGLTQHQDRVASSDRM